MSNDDIGNSAKKSSKFRGCSERCQRYGVNHYE